jgi:tetratricopeptide (TPR) repeat protein
VRPASPLKFRGDSWQLADSSIFIYRKSQIAFEYARRSSTSRSVFWIRANNLDNIESGYLAIAKELVPQFEAVDKIQILQTVRDQLAKRDASPWLLVLDDADDLDLLVGNQQRMDLGQFKTIDYIPFVAHGQVLVTTRQSSLVGMEDMVLAQNGIRVKEMTVEDGLSLFRRCMPSDLLSEASEARYRYFLDMLGGLPLAVVQATSYMREMQLPVEDFISLYQDIELHKKLFKKAASSVDKQQKSILITWEISYQKIAGSLHNGSKSHPAMLLDLLGFLDARSSPSLRRLSEGQFGFWDSNGSTPIDGLEGLFEQQQSPVSLLKEIYNSNLRKKPSHNLELAIGPLCNFSLVISRACWVHPVVHSWIYRRLSIEERHKYVSWLTEELLKQLAMADKGVQENWEDFVPGVTIRKLVTDELTPFRHALAVIRHAFSDAMRKFIRENKLSVGRFAQLLFEVGRMTASAGKTDKAIQYIQDALAAIKEDVHGGDLTLITEWQLHLAKVRSGKLSPSEATAEARACTSSSGGSSLQAILWLAECLRKEGRLPESLELLRNIMEAFSIQDASSFRRDKETFAAAVGKLYVLVEIADVDGKAEARRMIDESLAPFLRSMDHDHVLKILIYPKILLCRIEVAAGADDQAKALMDLVTHEYCSIDPMTLLTGGNPSSWGAQIDDLRKEGKWSVIEVVAQEYIRHRLPLSTLVRKSHALICGDRTSGQLEAFSSEVDHWCNIYNRLGIAYFEHQCFRKAEEMHWMAIGMWFSLCPNAIGSIGFTSNLWNLDQALERQGVIAEAKRRALDHHFSYMLTPRRLNQTLASIAR